MRLRITRRAVALGALIAVLAGGGALSAGADDAVPVVSDFTVTYSTNQCLVFTAVSGAESQAHAGLELVAVGQNLDKLPPGMNGAQISTRMQYHRLDLGSANPSFPSTVTTPLFDPALPNMPACIPVPGAGVYDLQLSALGTTITKTITVGAPAAVTSLSVKRSSTGRGYILSGTATPNATVLIQTIAFPTPGKNCHSCFGAAIEYPVYADVDAAGHYSESVNPLTKARAARKSLRNASAGLIWAQYKFSAIISSDTNFYEAGVVSDATGTKRDPYAAKHDDFPRTTQFGAIALKKPKK